MSSDASDTEDGEVFLIGSSVYFNADVTSETIGKLVRCLKKAERDVLCGCGVSDPVITLYINSCGGSVYDGFMGMDVISTSMVDVYTVACGYVASAATLLLLAGVRRFATQECSVLIHELSATLEGKYSTLIDEKKNAKLLMNKMRKVYLETTGLKPKELRDIMKSEKLLDAAACKAHRIVDEIIGRRATKRSVRDPMK
jgi:ATP-dependent protease ClpP protease subunit